MQCKPWRRMHLSLKPRHGDMMTWQVRPMDVRVSQETGTSIMDSFATHNPQVCLSADDLEGLNTLYPVSHGAILRRRWARHGQTREKISEIFSDLEPERV